MTHPSIVVATLVPVRSRSLSALACFLLGSCFAVLDAMSTWYALRFTDLSEGKSRVALGVRDRRRRTCARAPRGDRMLRARVPGVGCRRAAPVSGPAVQHRLPGAALRRHRDLGHGRGEQHHPDRRRATSASPDHSSLTATRDTGPQTWAGGPADAATGRAERASCSPGASVSGAGTLRRSERRVVKGFPLSA